MKKQILVSIIIIFLMAGSICTGAEPTSITNQRSSTKKSSYQPEATTLITEFFNNRVIEVNNTGTIVWMKSGLDGPTDAERLANGNTLIAEMMSNRVIEIDYSGTIVWVYDSLFGPFDVERLENGNTLISDTYNFRIIEVNSSGSVVWEIVLSGFACDAERLETGNTLITDWDNDRVIEVNSAGTIVWQTSAITPIDVERLENGNTLITEYYYGLRIKEVDSSGTLVWHYNCSDVPFDAERLTNGNTLITEFEYNNRVIEINSSGTIVWQKVGLDGPVDVERLFLQPDLTCSGSLSWTDVPAGSTVTGSFSIENSGEPGSLLDWEIISYPTWGTWTFTPSNGNDLTPEDEPVTINVSVVAPDKKNKQFIGNVTICNQDDPTDCCSIPVSLTTPKNKPFTFNNYLFDWLFEWFPNAFPLLRYFAQR